MSGLLVFAALFALIILVGYVYQWHHGARCRFVPPVTGVSSEDKARTEQQLDHQPRTWFG